MRFLDIQDKLSQQQQALKLIFWTSYAFNEGNVCLWQTDRQTGRQADKKILLIYLNPGRFALKPFSPQLFGLDVSPPSRFTHTSCITTPSPLIRP